MLMVLPSWSNVGINNYKKVGQRKKENLSEYNDNCLENRLAKSNNTINLCSMENQYMERIRGMG